MLPPAGQKTGRVDVDLFFERLRQLHTEPYMCRTEKETGDILRRLVGQARSVVIAGLPTKVAKMVRSSLVGVSCTSVEELVATDAVGALAEAEVGVTWARHGVVNQGALVEIVEDDAQKLASCLPQAHIAMVSSASLLPDLQAAMKEVGRIIASSPPERRPIVSFISGPSKTGDIEMRLLYGVHGPLSLQVLLLDWA
jgi:L-lactate dehydrogenase complex protein LldG